MLHSFILWIGLSPKIGSKIHRKIVSFSGVSYTGFNNHCTKILFDTKSFQNNHFVKLTLPFSELKNFDHKLVKKMNHEFIAFEMTLIQPLKFIE